MGKIRRVITGHDAEGRSVIASEQMTEGNALPGLPGVYLNTMWGAETAQEYPNAGDVPAYHDFFAPLGGVRFFEFILAPDSTPPEDISPEVAAAESERLFPGLMGRMDPDDPGMHRSATTDMLYVVSGRCVLELDDGSENELSAGDVLIQSGTMHRWKNPWDEPCRIIGTLVGAHLLPIPGDEPANSS